MLPPNKAANKKGEADLSETEDRKAASRPDASIDVQIDDGTRVFFDQTRAAVPVGQSTSFQPSPSDAKPPKPHYHGHRQRLRERFLKGGANALADYELLELLLCMAMPRGDVKPLAKSLITQFGSFANVLAARPEDLQKAKGLGDAGIAAIKVAEASAQYLARERAMELPVIASWEQLIDYCRVRLGHRKTEELHLLFLDRKNRLIADECHQTGTVDHTPVYPREVIKRALELHASAIILVHNHPSGDATPSRGDIDMTRKIVEAAKAMEITIHDHIIISQAGYNSFKTLGLI
ncbi:MAG: DNA repair protein RadC [Thalassospira sp.]|nr:JAB domain-containing protein [Thalassospira sp.]MCD1596054.1 DNA repair protein RadC [Thalassospira xiamenensis]OCK10134.1 DNA repair protein RadC [Thalassospira sp. KO164]PXX27033.1 DNA repair protein RadC [Thalassospira sp. 11-3]QPL34602.1 DNA repair protein RadC [Thalassospira sp. B30-1]SEE89161.1 DNA repair protein RadC [Thalassospira permensis]